MTDRCVHCWTTEGQMAHLTDAWGRPVVYCAKCAKGE